MELFNDLAKNVIIFGLDNRSSSHTDKGIINFLLSEGSTDCINDSTGAAEKKFTVKFSKANTKFCWNLHYNGDESYLYVNKTEICKFKAKDNISGYNFCLGRVSKDFTKDKQDEIASIGTVNDISVDVSSVKKEDILNIHQYLMVKNNIKCLGLLKNIYWIIIVSIVKASTI